MLALAIDTSSDLASITLAREDSVVVELTFRHKMNLLRRLMPLVDRAFTDAEVDKTSLDGVVVSTGPGSFTGLRIGVATAKAIAFGLRKPIVGIGTLDVLANAAPAVSGLVVPIIHARPGEVYCAVFRRCGDDLARQSEDKALAVDELAAELKSSSDGPVVFCGDGVERNAAVLSNLLPKASPAPPWFKYPRGSVLAALGIDHLEKGEVDDAISLVPHYVKRSTPEIRLSSSR